MSDLAQRHRVLANSYSNRDGNVCAAICQFHNETADALEAKDKDVNGLMTLLAKEKAKCERLRDAIKFAIAQFEHDEFRSVIEQGLEEALAAVKEASDE